VCRQSLGEREWGRSGHIWTYLDIFENIWADGRRSSLSPIIPNHPPIICTHHPPIIYTYHLHPSSTCLPLEPGENSSTRSHEASFVGKLRTWSGNRGGGGEGEGKGKGEEKGSKWEGLALILAGHSAHNPAGQDDQMFMHSCIHAFTYSCVHIFMRSYIHAFMPSCIHIFIRSYVHMSIFSCLNVT
jgi:hypothetical protein